MNNIALMGTHFAKLLYALLILPVCWGCAHIDRASINYYKSNAPTHYVIIAPKGRANLACVSEFISFKKQQGFDVKLVEFNAENSEIDRYNEIGRLLREVRPPQGRAAYALMMASSSELPMPGLPVGRNMFVETDLLFYLNAEGKVFNSKSEVFWEQMLASDFPWIFGRLPFDTEESLKTSIHSTMSFSKRTNGSPPFALLGAERIGSPSDSALVLSLAKQRFLKQGWKAELYATDKPNDKTITSRPAGSPADLQFIERWSRDHPRIVYALSHAGLGPGLATDKDFALGQGKCLIPVSTLRLIQGDRERILAPQTPAVFLSTGCGLGIPSNQLVNVLFENKWIVAMIATTTENGSDPLFPAITANINIAECLVKGLSIGLALRATQRIYYDQSYGPLQFLLDEKTKARIAENIVGYTIYGDPSLTCQPWIGREAIFLPPDQNPGNSTPAVPDSEQNVHPSRLAGT